MSVSGHENGWRGDSLEVRVSDIDTTSSESSDLTPALFHEVQRFKQWVFLIPVIAVTAIVWWQFVQQIMLDNPQGEEPIPNWLVWLFTILFGIGLPVLAAKMRLITEVRPGRVTVRLAPFRERTVAVDEILKGVVRSYSALREYGGWGVKTSHWNGRAYIAYGDKGVQLVLAAKELVLIGSQRPEELLSALVLAGADLSRYDALVAEAAAVDEADDEDQLDDDDEARARL